MVQWKQIQLVTMRLQFHPWPCSVGQRSSIAMTCGVGQRCSSDLALLRLWRRLAATVPIRPLAWEPPFNVGVVLKKRQKKRKKEKKRSSRRGAVVNESD